MSPRRRRATRIIDSGTVTIIASQTSHGTQPISANAVSRP